MNEQESPFPDPLYEKRKRRMLRSAGIDLAAMLLFLLCLVLSPALLMAKQAAWALGLFLGAALWLAVLLLNRRVSASKRTLSPYEIPVRDPGTFLNRLEQAISARDLGGKGAYACFAHGKLQMRYLRQNCGREPAGLAPDRKWLYRQIHKAGDWTEEIPARNPYVQIMLVVYGRDFAGQEKSVQPNVAALLRRGIPLVNASFSQRDGMLRLPALCGGPDLPELKKYCAAVEFLAKAALEPEDP